MPRAIAGARAELFFGNIRAGWATGISATENIQNQRIDVLGDIDTKEIEPIGRSVTMTADFVRILGESLQAMGIWPQGATADVVDYPPMNATVYDSVGETPIYKIKGLKAETKSWRVDRSGVMTLNATFQGIKMNDEAGV